MTERSNSSEGILDQKHVDSTFLVNMSVNYRDWIAQFQILQITASSMELFSEQIRSLLHCLERGEDKTLSACLPETGREKTRRLESPKIKGE